MATPDYDDEQALLSAVKAAMAHVSAGEPPTAAVVKVAGDRRLMPGEIRLVCAALNNGMQTAQVKANPSALDKFAGFPLADPDAVVRSVYDAPARKVAAASDAPAALEKAASDAPPPAPAPRRRDPVDVLLQLRKEAEEASRRASEARDNVGRLYGGLVSYFKQASRDRVPFADLDAAARAYLGPRGKAAMDLLARRFPGEKRAGDSLRTSGPVDTRTGPFAALREAVAASAVAALALREKAAAEARVAAQEAGPAARFAAAFAPRPKEASTAGSAAVYAGVSQGMAELRDRLVPDHDKDPVADARRDLEDPAHENELRRIRARVMLHSLMSDPDDPVSGHSPEEVASAYNELSQVAPHGAELPAVMAPLLRKRLGGRFEPFEAKELIDIEKGLGDTRAMPEVAPKTPALVTHTAGPRK